MSKFHRLKYSFIWPYLFIWHLRVVLLENLDFYQNSIQNNFDGHRRKTLWVFLMRNFEISFLKSCWNQNTMHICFLNTFRMIIKKIPANDNYLLLQKRRKQSNTTLNGIPVTFWWNWAVSLIPTAASLPFDLGLQLVEKQQTKPQLKALERKKNG